MPNWRRRVVDLLLSGVAAVEPERLVLNALGELALRPSDGITVVAVGKAAVRMARGARVALGEAAGGLIVAPEAASPVPGFETLVGEHPIPGTGSFAAGDRLLELADGLDASSTLLVLLSGGASALCEVPAPGVTRQQIAAATTQMLASGAPIGEINQARTALSALKGGGLTAAARPARVITLALSDVAGSSPETIGSGPTVGCDLYEIIGDGSTAAAAVAAHCSAAGLGVRRWTLQGLAGVAGFELGRAALDLEPGQAIVGHGETTVAVSGGGRGGRNQEVALAAAIAIEGSDVVVAAIGTDGIDGPTPNAGAAVDGTTVGRGRRKGFDAHRLLADHDSATFHEAVGSAIITGPTGTNVADLVLAVRPRRRRQRSKLRRR